MKFLVRIRHWFKWFKQFFDPAVKRQRNEAKKAEEMARFLDRNRKKDDQD